MGSVRETGRKFARIFSHQEKRGGAKKRKNPDFFGEVYVRGGAQLWRTDFRFLDSHFLFRRGGAL
jgi:hypothetical protein